MKRYIYSIIFAIALFGIGLITLVYQLNNFSFINKEIKKEENILTFSDNYKYKILCNFCKINYIDQDSDYNIVKIKYPNNYYNYDIEEEYKKNNKYLKIEIEDVNRQNIYDLIINDIKNKTIRNYIDDFMMEVDVYMRVSDNYE